MTKLVFDGAVNAAKGAKLNSKSGRAAAEGQQGVDPLTGVALAAPVQGASQAKVGAVPTVAGKGAPKVDVAKVVKPEADAKDENHKDEAAQPTSQGEHLAMVDAASAAAVGVMTTETVAAQGEGGSSDSSDGGDDSTPLIIGGLVLVGGGIAAAASGGGGNSTPTPTPTNTAPTFAAASATANAAENAAATTVVYKAVATDTAGDTITYSISGGADAALFNINASTGEVTFKASPNFEVKADNGANGVYDIVVTAKDAGGLSATQNVAITVTNVNEAPTFAAASQAVNFAENTAAATVVATSTATDVDGGDTLTYSLSGADAALFNINATTGAITFKASPNFEAPGDVGANNVYDVIVTAKDAGGLTATQNVAITVTDTNEAPAISSNGGGDTAAISVAENTTAVTTVTSTDVDAGAGKTFSISGGADAALFAIDAATGVLTFISAPNFEAPGDAGANNVYDVVVKVTDNGNPGLTDSQAIAVTVTDVNEAPVISSNGGGDTAAVSVAENSTAVTTVTSTDVDAGAGKTFSISGGADAALFAIDAATGVLTFVTAPNFEAPADSGANNVYDVVVKVTDNGNPGLTDTQAIAVTVTNVVEPVVAVADSFAVTEGATLNGVVSTNDTLEGNVTYSLVNPGAAPAGLTFTAGSSTGSFIFNANDPAYNSLAAGATQNVTFDYTVTNGLTTSTATATIVVTGTNDDPTITSNGGAATAAVSVAENSTAVTTVTSTDVDAGATAVYSISGGADAALFAIDATTGVLTFKAAPNFEAPADAGTNNVYDVVVQVSDGTAVDTQAIAVTVTDANDSPVISSNGGGATAAVSVAENSTAVTTVTSTDADAGATAVYSISGGADAALFAIDATTGVLTFITAPNFEAPGDAGANNIYDVIVQVNDGTATDTQAIAVTVTDVNEIPVITSNGGGATAAVSVAENSTAVTTVTSTDVDAGATAAYSISGGADAALFAIDTATGVLTFKAAPNFEAPGDAGANNVYDVVVQVSDGTNVDTQAIAVTVTDVLEFAPLSLDGGYPGDDNSTGTQDPINAALDAFLFTDNGNGSNNVIINGFGANDRFQFTLSQLPGADAAYSFGTADGGRDLTIGYANGGTATTIIVVNDVLQPGSFALDEVAANAALNTALGTNNIDYFQIA